MALRSLRRASLLQTATYCRLFFTPATDGTSITPKAIVTPAAVVIGIIPKASVTPATAGTRTILKATAKPDRCHSDLWQHRLWRHRAWTCSGTFATPTTPAPASDRPPSPLRCPLRCPRHPRRFTAPLSPRSHDQAAVASSYSLDTAIAPLTRDTPTSSHRPPPFNAHRHPLSYHSQRHQCRRHRTSSSRRIDRASHQHTPYRRQASRRFRPGRFPFPLRTRPEPSGA